MLYVCLFSGFLYLLMQGILAWGWHKGSRSNEHPRKLPPLSVVVAAHDEYSNLQAHLPYLLAQSYPDFEVVVVLDRCSDGSQQLLAELQQQDARLRFIAVSSTPPEWAPKKWALTQGILAARYDHLAFTDADCLAEAEWLKGIGRSFAAKHEVILGLGLYRSYPGWLNRFIRWETFYAAFQYIGLAGLGFPYMGVGRNLAYSRSFWQEKGGFQTFKSSLSGDDDLFVNAFAREARTAVLFTPGTRTWSEPKRHIGDWVRQKVRHVSASVRYGFQTQVTLGIIHLSHMAFYGAFFVEWALFGLSWMLCGLFLVRILASWYIFGTVNRLIGEKRLLICYPILDLLFFLYNLSIVPLGLIARPKAWKKNREYPKTQRKIVSW